MVGILGNNSLLLLLISPFFVFCQKEYLITHEEAELIEFDNLLEFLPDTPKTNFEINGVIGCLVFPVLEGEFNHNLSKKGTWVLYEPNGLIKLKCKFGNNEKIKLYQLFEDSTLRLSKNTNIINVTRSKSYSYQGLLVESKLTKNNILIGKYREFHPSGTIKTKAHYSRTFWWFNERKELANEYGIRNRKKIEYYSDGRKRFIMKFRKDEITKTKQF